MFRDKASGTRVQGVLTADGYSAFEDARFRLSKIAGRHVDECSDADVIEFLARGDRATRDYLKLLGA